ncbi:MAG: hypothetical protein Q4E54_07085 [Lachnospiraceae bacterium]|nr:hypothetical protein [Lachnospiraceae bacterium]
MFVIDEIEKEKNKDLKQVVLFVMFSSIAAVAQLVSRAVIDILLKNLTQMVEVWPFGRQALGSFIAFLVSNIIAKVVSYVTNRKTTFKANNNKVRSAIIYTIMVVLLIIIETVIGTPLQNGLYNILGGTFTGSELTTASADKQTLYQICGMLSQAIYGFGDGLIVFFMDKYVIMRNDDISDKVSKNK